MDCTCFKNSIAQVQTIPVNISFVTQSNILNDFDEGTAVSVETLGTTLVTSSFGQMKNLGGKIIEPGWYEFPFFHYPQKKVVNTIYVPVASNPRFDLTIMANNFKKSFSIPVFHYPPEKQLQELNTLHIVYLGNRQFGPWGSYEDVQPIHLI